jgi:hypothetical protein
MPMALAASSSVALGSTSTGRPLIVSLNMVILSEQPSALFV